MNLSISSFKNELKVFAVALVLMTAMELAQLASFAKRGEAVYTQNFPRLADQLSTSPGTSVVLVGNSLTQTGYDMPLLRQRLEAEGHADLHVENIALSGSAPAEWYHVFASNFVYRNKSPDVVVIGMSPDGIADGLPAGYRIGWLANETSWGEVPEVLFKDLRDIEVDGQYLQARVSPLYADRWEIRMGTLYRLIPNIWPGMEWVNSGQLAARPNVAAIAEPTYSLLTRLIELAQSNHIHPVLIAMPARDHYDIEPGLVTLLKRYKVTFLDSRIVPGLTIDGFKDGWHLTPDGAKIFTPYIATQLPLALKSAGIYPSTRAARAMPH